MFQTIITSILAFASTNIDDIFILTILYASHKFKGPQIVLGQYIGIAALLVLSFIGSLLGSFVDQRLIGLLGLFPIYLALKQIYELVKKSNEADDDDTESIATKSTGIISVASITIANGADNIGVYVPLLTTMNMATKIQLVIVFALMVYLWCLAGKYLAHHPLIAKQLNRYGHILTPIVLLLLGIFILYENGSYTLLR